MARVAEFFCSGFHKFGRKITNYRKTRLFVLMNHHKLTHSRVIYLLVNLKHITTCRKLIKQPFNTNIIQLIFQMFVNNFLPNISSLDEESSSISFSLLSPVVSSHVMLWLPMTFTAKQPSVIEHHVVQWTADDTFTDLKMFVSLLFG